MSADVDLLVLSLGTTRGLRVADRTFAALAARAGASVTMAGVRVGWTRRLRRAYPVIDLVEALAARRALEPPLRRHRPRAVVFSTTTAALLAPRLAVPYAVRLDAPAALNRPGARNALQHALERRRLRAARVVLPWSRAAQAALPPGGARAVVVPPPVVASGPGDGRREPLAVAYTPDPKAKGLDVVCAAWAAAALPGARLAVYGIDPPRGRAFLARRGVPEPPGIEWRGAVAAEEFRAALRRARALVGGARWEDFGQAPLEALADGCPLATVPSGGPFEALALARELEPALVADAIDPGALAACVRAAFALDDERLAAYRARAAPALARFHPDRIFATLAGEVLPALLGAPHRCSSRGAAVKPQKSL